MLLMSGAVSLRCQEGISQVYRVAGSGVGQKFQGESLGFWMLCEVGS